MCLYSCYYRSTLLLLLLHNNNYNSSHRHVLFFPFPTHDLRSLMFIIISTSSIFSVARFFLSCSSLVPSLAMFRQSEHKINCYFSLFPLTSSSQPIRGVFRTVTVGDIRTDNRTHVWVRMRSSTLYLWGCVCIAHSNKSFKHFIVIFTTRTISRRPITSLCTICMASDWRTTAQRTYQINNNIVDACTT